MEQVLLDQRGGYRLRSMARRSCVSCPECICRICLRCRGGMGLEDRCWRFSGRVTGALSSPVVYSRVGHMHDICRLEEAAEATRENDNIETPKIGRERPKVCRLVAGGSWISNFRFREISFVSRLCQPALVNIVGSLPPYRGGCVAASSFRGLPFSTGVRSHSKSITLRMSDVLVVSPVRITLASAVWRRGLIRSM